LRGGKQEDAKGYGNDNQKDKEEFKETFGKVAVHLLILTRN